MSHSSDYQPDPDVVKISSVCSNEDKNETSDDSLELLSRDGEDESETELATSESISQSDDGAYQSETDVGLQICNEGAETKLTPESNARQRNPGLGPQFDNLEYHLRAEEISDESSDREMESGLDSEYESDELAPNGFKGQTLTSEVPHAVKPLILVEIAILDTMIIFTFIFALGVILGATVHYVLANNGLFL